MIYFRCECHGHAATCNHTTLPYVCDCLPESHTQGRQVCNIESNQCKHLFYFKYLTDFYKSTSDTCFLNDQPLLMCNCWVLKN